MIIVGLGNPGQEFTGTRHNLGFVVLDQLAATLGVSWAHERDVMVARIGHDWLIKPWTYMNRSGAALKDFFAYHNISTDPADLHRDLLVVHDELDFEPGVWKTQRGRSSAGHNGVQSIIDACGTKDFNRLRIGIGNGQSSGIPGEDYVLQSIPAPDREPLVQAISAAVESIISKIKK